MPEIEHGVGASERVASPAPLTWNSLGSAAAELNLTSLGQNLAGFQPALPEVLCTYGTEWATSSEQPPLSARRRVRRQRWCRRNTRSPRQTHRHKCHTGKCQCRDLDSPTGEKKHRAQDLESLHLLPVHTVNLQMVWLLHLSRVKVPHKSAQIVSAKLKFEIT